MTNRNLRYSGLGLAVLAAGAIVACGSSDSGTPAATAGSGTGGAHNGSGGAAGSSTAGLPGTAGAGLAGAAAGGAAGTAGGGGIAGGAGYPCAGTIPSAALITDFSNLAASTTSTGQYTFSGGVMGGTFTYQTNALTLDTMTNTVLNIKGNVMDYDGFGVYFNTCYDASTYTGVSFNIKGNVGPTGKLNFRVQTNSDTAVGSASNPKGTCVPTSATNTYPDCHSASIDITVPPAGGVVTVNFSQLMGGLPVATVSSKEIVGLEWAFNWTPAPAGGAGAGAGGASAGSGGASGGAGGAKGGSGGASGGTTGASAGAGGAAPGPYDANVTIDDIMFIGGPPAGGAGGAGAGAGAGGAGAGAGGASAGAGGKAGGGGSSGKGGTGGA